MVWVEQPMWQAVQRRGWTGDLEGVIVRTFDAGTTGRTQLSHVADETIQMYAHQLETSTETHACVFIGIGTKRLLDLTRAVSVNHVNLTVFKLILRSPNYDDHRLILCSDVGSEVSHLAEIAAKTTAWKSHRTEAFWPSNNKFV